MPDQQPYTTREGWLGKHECGTYVLLRSRRDFPLTDEISALVVTGDLDAARRRLAPPSDAAIERAARALYAYGASPMAVDWDRATETTKMQHRLTAHVAIVALAAAEAPRG